jgi:hypothetical protein
MGFASDPQNELQETLLGDALGNRDECYGFLDGDILAPTDGIPNAHYVHMHKGFARLAHRGQRLHAVGMTRALDAYLSRGYKGIVSYVE